MSAQTIPKVFVTVANSLLANTGCAQRKTHPRSVPVRLFSRIVGMFSVSRKVILESEKKWSQIQRFFLCGDKGEEQIRMQVVRCFRFFCLCHLSPSASLRDLARLRNKNVQLLSLTV